jgi:hypothetical protein
VVCILLRCCGLQRPVLLNILPYQKYYLYLTPCTITTLKSIKSANIFCLFVMEVPEPKMIFFLNGFFFLIIVSERVVALYGHRYNNLLVYICWMLYFKIFFYMNSHSDKIFGKQKRVC